MAASDEAPEKAQKRAEGYGHFFGGRQHKLQPASWETTIGRRVGDQAKDRLISERLCRQHWRSGRHPCELGTRSPAAVWTGQGATRLAGEETQSRDGALSCAAAAGEMGTGASRSQHHDRGGEVG